MGFSYIYYSAWLFIAQDFLNREIFNLNSFQCPSILHYSPDYINLIRAGFGLSKNNLSNAELHFNLLFRELQCLESHSRFFPLPNKPRKNFIPVVELHFGHFHGESLKQKRNSRKDIHHDGFYSLSQTHKRVRIPS